MFFPPLILQRSMDRPCHGQVPAAKICPRVMVIDVIQDALTTVMVPEMRCRIGSTGAAEAM